MWQVLVTLFLNVTASAFTVYTTSFGCCTATVTAVTVPGTVEMLSIGKCCKPFAVIDVANVTAVTLGPGVVTKVYGTVDGTSYEATAIGGVPWISLPGAAVVGKRLARVRRRLRKAGVGDS